MNLIKSLVIVFLLSWTYSGYGQIRFSETIQTSKTATNTEASLFFIDFWATWCGPCVYAGEYLSVLQKQYPDRLYIVSLSEENPDIVKRFLKKKPTELAVSIDYNGETFDANNTRTLPYGLLINADGKVLWKGNPTDFKRADLERFMRLNTKMKDIGNVIKVEEIKEVYEADYMPNLDVEIKPLENESYDMLVKNDKGNYIQYKGYLKSIIAKEYKILEQQVQIAPELNKTYEVYVKKGVQATSSILEDLKLDLYHTETNGEVLQLDISNIKYWDTQQIDWGKDAAEYLIGDSQIQADNVTFKDVTFELASVLSLPVTTTGGEADDNKHDWLIHYRFYNLMQSDLEDTYGIKASKEMGDFKIYTIRKKTP